MLVALSGVTGVGKSYFKECVINELDYDVVHTIRTRKRRETETKKMCGLFMTSKQIDELEKYDKIAYRFKVFGNEYAYLKDEIFSKQNRIFEMHYSTVYDFKKINSNIKTIYILPNNLEIAKEKAILRNMTKEQTKIRIKDIEEQYFKFVNDKELQKQFDYIVVNNYDDESKEKILNIVKNLKKES